MSWLFTPGGQSIGASALASVLPINIQGWFPLGLTHLISLLSKGLSRVFSSSTVQKHQFFGAQPSLWSDSHICTWLLEKNIALTIWTFVSKMMSLLFNILSRFVVRVCSDSCPLSQWCHPTISSSVGPFSCCLQSFPASGSFPMSQLFPSGGQSIGASASALVLPMNIQGWFLLGLTGLICLLSKGLSRVLSSSTVQKHQFFSAQPYLWSNSHIHTWLLEKSLHSFDMDLCWQSDISAF